MREEMSMRLASITVTACLLMFLGCKTVAVKSAMVLYYEVPYRSDSPETQALIREFRHEMDLMLFDVLDLRDKTIIDAFDMIMIVARKKEWGLGLVLNLPHHTSKRASRLRSRASARGTSWRAERWSL